MAKKASTKDRKLYIGWDVGAWHCDRGRSRDALVAFEDGEEGLSPVGEWWRGNLRNTLMGHQGADLIRCLLGCLLKLRELVDNQLELGVLFAIDTPLGWPKATTELLQQGELVQVGQDGNKDPYCFRKTEMRSFVLPPQRKTPLSVVRDRIGSQSTKGMYFLRKADLCPDSVGVWSSRARNLQVTVIETYPAPCRATGCLTEDFERITSHLFNEHEVSSPERRDVEDAVFCAIVAHMFDQQQDKLAPPPAGTPESEGWIWVPTDCLRGNA